MLFIPEEHHPSLRLLNSIGDDQAQAVIDALGKAEPAESIPALASELSAESGLPRGTAEGIVQVLLALYGVRSGFKVSVGRFVDDVILAAQRLIDDDDDSEGSIDWRPLKKRLKPLLSLEDSIGVTSKALNVMADHQRVFRDARIFSDLRGVFGSDPKARPILNTIVHTMRLDFNEREERKAFFVAMDKNDLRAMKRVIDRALAKDKTLRSESRENGIPCLDVESLKG